MQMSRISAGYWRKRWPLAGALLCLLATPWHSAAAQQPAATAPIRVELNKLEPLPATAATPGSDAPSGPGCRVYVVVGNPDPEPINQLRLDLILFGTDDVIARRIAFDLAPLGAKRTAVRLFDLVGLPCDHIGHVLINDVLTCQIGAASSVPADQAREACLDRLQVSSKAKAELTK
jgi:hypothetical protein